MTANRIALITGGRIEEGVAGGAINPGHLIAIGSAGTYAVHGTAGGIAERAFAVEDALQSRTRTNAYASGERVTFLLAKKGDAVLARVKAAAVAIVVGDKLISAGDGTLIKTTGTPVDTVAIALDAVDNSAGAAEVMLRVRVL